MQVSPTRAPLVPIGYGAGAAALGASAIVTPGAPRWVLGSTAFALLCDFGPSAKRDWCSSTEATDGAVRLLLENSPEFVLVDNFVTNLGPEIKEQTERKEAAAQVLAACNRWALFVRGRMLADVLGVAVMLKYSACVGAANVEGNVMGMG